jgi:hypothetical protein
MKANFVIPLLELNMKQQADPSPSVSTIRVIKIETCLNLSKKSELGYQIGCTPDAALFIRLSSNSRSGKFNADWISFEAIERQLKQYPIDKSITSGSMQVMYKGKSTNSKAFLFAVLKAEGLVRVCDEKSGSYMVSDIDGFQTRIAALIPTGIEIQAAEDNHVSTPKPRSRKLKES